MYSLVQAFEKVFKEIGGKILVGTEVQKIKVSRQKVEGVIAKDQFYPAEVVISNADFAHTYAL